MFFSFCVESICSCASAEISYWFLGSSFVTDYCFFCQESSKGHKSLTLFFKKNSKFLCKDLQLSFVIHILGSMHKIQFGTQLIIIDGYYLVLCSIYLVFYISVPFWVCLHHLCVLSSCLSILFHFLLRIHDSTAIFILQTTITTCCLYCAAHYQVLQDMCVARIKD